MYNSIIFRYVYIHETIMIFKLMNISIIPKSFFVYYLNFLQETNNVFILLSIILHCKDVM